jgi:hypothetical protein
LSDYQGNFIIFPECSSPVVINVFERKYSCQPTYHQNSLWHKSLNFDFKHVNGVTCCSLVYKDKLECDNLHLFVSSDTFSLQIDQNFSMNQYDQHRRAIKFGGLFLDNIVFPRLFIQNKRFCNILPVRPNNAKSILTFPRNKEQMNQ